VFSVIGGVLVAGMVAMGAALLGLGLGALLRQFPNPDLAALLPGALLTLVTLILLLTSFGLALGSLFLTSDLDTLMSAPIDTRAVFLSKLLDAMLPSYMILGVSALPALLSYGLGLGYGPLYFVGVVLAIIATPLLPVGLASVLVMLVARIAPVRRVREVLGLMGALFGVGCAVAGNTSRYWMTNFIPDQTDATATFENIRGLVNIPVPPLMAGRGLAALGYGDWGVAFLSFGAFLGVVFLVFAFCVWVANSLYAAGWLRMQSSGNARRSKQRNVRAAARSGLLGRGPAWLAIMFKDWRTIPRDLRNFAQMLAPLVLLPVIFFNLLNGGRGGRNPLQEISRFGGGVDGTGVLVAGGVLMATLFVFGRISETAISMESKSWWLLKAAPISAGEVLWGKFMSAAVPYVVVSSLLMLIAEVWKGFNLVWFVYGWFGVEVLGLGMLAVSTGLAVPWAKLDWDDPKRMLSWQTAILTLVAWTVLAMLGGLILCLPLIVQMFNPANSGLVAVMMPMSAIVTALLMAGVGYAAFRLGMSRVGEVGDA
jgi:ABC-2 type transport system permease protein